MTLGAGAYEYCYVPETDYRKPYSKDTTLNRIAADGNAMKVLAKYAPAIAGIAASGDPELGTNTLEDISHKGFLPFEPEKLGRRLRKCRSWLWGDRYGLEPFGADCICNIWNRIAQALRGLVL